MTHSPPRLNWFEHPRLPSLLLALAITYWLISLGLAHRTITGPLNNNERLPATHASTGTAILDVDWGLPTLGRATFFTDGKHKLTDTDLSHIKVKVESPIGTPLQTAYSLGANQDKQSLLIDFKPAIKTKETLRITLNGPPDIPWKYQARSQNTRLLKSMGESCPATLLLPGLNRLWLTLLAVFGAGFILSALRLRSDTREYLPIFFFAATGFMIALSARSMEARIWAWWGEYWPDGYLQQALSLKRWVEGEITYRQTGLTTYRNGQTWLVPMILTWLIKAGFSESGAYFWLTVTAVLTSIGTVAYWLWRQFQNAIAAALFIILAASLIPMVRSGASLTTDGAALLPLAGFVVAFGHLIMNPKSRGAVWLVGIVIALGCQVRLSMLPLLLVPITVACWLGLLKWRSGATFGGSFKNGIRLGLPTILSGLLLGLSWHVMDVFKTFKLAKDFAALPDFSSAFKWSDYLRNTLACLYPLIVVACLGGVKMLAAKLRKPTETELMLIVSILGFLALLAVGKIIPWYRYWAPIAFLGACLVAVASASFSATRMKIAATLCLGINFLLLLQNQQL